MRSFCPSRSPFVIPVLSFVIPAKAGIHHSAPPLTLAGVVSPSHGFLIALGFASLVRNDKEEVPRAE